MNLFTVDKKFYLVLDEKNSQVIISQRLKYSFYPWNLPFDLEDFVR